MLNVSTIENGNTVWYRLSGRMDGGPTCQCLRTAVKTHVGQGHRDFVFDLEELVSMSSRGIGCLVASYASIQSAEGRMALRAPNERVRHVLEVCRLLPGVFKLIDDPVPDRGDPTPSSTRSDRDEDQGTSRAGRPRPGDLGATGRRQRQRQAGVRDQGARPPR